MLLSLDRFVDSKPAAIRGCNYSVQAIIITEILLNNDQLSMKQQTSLTFYPLSAPSHLSRLSIPIPIIGTRVPPPPHTKPALSSP